MTVAQSSLFIDAVGCRVIESSEPAVVVCRFDIRQVHQELLGLGLIDIAEDSVYLAQCCCHSASCDARVCLHAARPTITHHLAIVRYTSSVVSRKCEPGRFPDVSHAILLVTDIKHYAIDPSDEVLARGDITNLQRVSSVPGTSLPSAAMPPIKASWPDRVMHKSQLTAQRPSSTSTMSTDSVVASMRTPSADCRNRLRALSTTPKHASCASLTVPERSKPSKTGWVKRFSWETMDISIKSTLEEEPFTWDPGAGHSRDVLMQLAESAIVLVIVTMDQKKWWYELLASKSDNSLIRLCTVNLLLAFGVSSGSPSMSIRRRHAVNFIYKEETFPTLLISDPSVP